MLKDLARDFITLAAKAKMLYNIFNYDNITGSPYKLISQ